VLALLLQLLLLQLLVWLLSETVAGRAGHITSESSCSVTPATTQNITYNSGTGDGHATHPAIMIRHAAVGLVACLFDVCWRRRCCCCCCRRCCCSCQSSLLQLLVWLLSETVAGRAGHITSESSCHVLGNYTNYYIQLGHRR
jgi:hypothetical protein